MFVILTFNIFFISSTLNKSCVFIKSQTRKKDKHDILHCIEFPLLLFSIINDILHCIEFALLLFSIIMTYCIVSNSPYFYFLLSWHTALYRIGITSVFYKHDILRCIEFALLLFSIINDILHCIEFTLLLFSIINDILHCIEFALLLFSIIMTYYTIEFALLLSSISMTYLTVSNSPYFCFL